MTRRVIIVGKGLGWGAAPDGGDFDEVWGVNNICLRRQVDLAFNMHDLRKHKDHKLFTETVDYVNQHGIPIVTQKKYDFIPTAIPFPLDYFERHYFTNSIDYMVAYAAYASYEIAEYMYLNTLELYGIVMAVGTEYEMQRPSLEYWLGYAEGAGISVTVHEPTRLFKHPTREGLYGYDWDEEDMPHVKERSENK